MAGGLPGRPSRSISRLPISRRRDARSDPRAGAISAASALTLPGTMAPSESFITSVGSSAPRLGSISSRENRVSTAGAPNARRQRPGHRRRADVVGDVAGELVRRQAERAVFGRQRVRGVVAQHDEPALQRALDRLHGSEGRSNVGIWACAVCHGGKLSKAPVDVMLAPALGATQERRGNGRCERGPR